MKCFYVTFELLNIDRKYALTVWDYNLDDALRSALNWWGDRAVLKSINVVYDEKYLLPIEE